MRVNDDYVEWNAAAQTGNADSVHAFWKHAIEVWKQYDILVSQLMTLSLGVHRWMGSRKLQDAFLRWDPEWTNWGKRVCFWTGIDAIRSWIGDPNNRLAWWGRGVVWHTVPPPPGPPGRWARSVKYAISSLQILGLTLDERSSPLDYDSVGKAVPEPGDRACECDED